MTAAEQSPSTRLLDAASSEEALAYYKSQYEQLEHELAEFQASSRELEAELEKDIEASEQRERKLQERVESLGFEVEEWKTKYKQSKAEANAVQNNLQKEITSLRDAHRTTQLRLRDIEVANDDIERQARNTSSSLEDLESKYNVAIERAVMLEAEIQVGEQERESLRIEAQRLRDELSDLRIEADITQEKVRRLESTAEARHRQPQALPAATPVAPQFVQTETSPASTVSSPTRTTPPPPKSTSTSVSETPTPPSPPASEVSVNATPTMKIPTPMVKPRIASAELQVTSRSSRSSLRLQRPSRVTAGAPTDSYSRNSLAHRPSLAGGKSAPPGTLPSSSSLRQIRGLIGQVQRLEQRVQSARSRLPGPTASSAAGSPRGEVAARPDADIPASVTVRSHKKRSGGSNITRESMDGAEDTTPLPARRTSRISSGIPTAYATPRGDSRPSSRAGAASQTSLTYGHGPSMVPRPGSRASLTGSRTPLGHHYSSSTLTESRRPRSSIAGHYSSLHGHSMSVSGLDDSALVGLGTPTPRRNTVTPNDAGSADGSNGPSGIPTPSSSSIGRLSAGGGGGGPGRGSLRLSHAGSSTGAPAAGPPRTEQDRRMGPPERRRPLKG